jgi:hypothetical protein
VIEIGPTSQTTLASNLSLELEGKLQLQLKLKLPCPLYTGLFPSIARLFALIQPTGNNTRPRESTYLRYTFSNTSSVFPLPV